MPSVKTEESAVPARMAYIHVVLPLQVRELPRLLAPRRRGREVAEPQPHCSLPAGSVERNLRSPRPHRPLHACADPAWCGWGLAVEKSAEPCDRELRERTSARFVAAAGG